MEKCRLFCSDDFYLITNDPCVTERVLDLEQVSGGTYLYGYVFTEKDILTKKKAVHADSIRYISNHYSTCSGIFTLITYENEGEHNGMNIYVDPLCQSNIFYYCIGDIFYVSNNIFYIYSLNRNLQVNVDFLFDNFAYLSPLRQGTLIKDVHVLCREDFVNNSLILKKLAENNIRIPFSLDHDFKNLSYEMLKKLYIERLRKRVSILTENYERIHLSLTGGADSRLVLSAFDSYEKLRCYCFGGADYEDRIFSEVITEQLGIERSEKLYFFGKQLATTSLLFKAIFDSSCYKLFLLNGYMNSNKFRLENQCNITGYYGVNISGGVGYPTQKPYCSRHLDMPNSYFNYFDYVESFVKKHTDLRPCSLKDQFYINNRGKSHYAAQTEASLKRCNTFDVLYDVLNLDLVERAPFSDNHIDKCALSVDIMSEINPQLAFFPYAGKTIPRFREFKNTPLISCFQGFKFSNSTLGMVKPDIVSVNEAEFDIMGEGSEFTTHSSVLKKEAFDEFFEIYPSLLLFRESLATETLRPFQNMLLFFLLGKYMIEHFDEIPRFEKIL